MWCSECRFNGVRGGQRCGVVNADLAVSAVIIDVGERIQMLRLLYRDQRCGEGKKHLTVARWPAMWCSECRFSGVRGGHGCGVANVNVTFS